MMNTIDKAAVVWTIAIVAIGLIIVIYLDTYPPINPDNGNNGGGVNDIDKDTIDDNVDNCIEQPNTDQKNSDGDEVGDVCDDAPNGEYETQNDEITMENVITMRILRINYLSSYLNAIPDFDNDEKELIKTKLGEIQEDIKNNYSLSAYNKMYQFREHFDGAGTDELVSDKQTRKDIYILISDILLSQNKTLFLPTNNNP